MPVPGVARNALGERPNRFRRRALVFIAQPGRTPGLMAVDTRADTAAAGTIRRLYRQAVNYLSATPAFSWTANRADSDSPAGAEVTIATRYKASSLYRQAGSDNTRFGGRRPVVQARHNMRPVTVSAGNKQSRPTRRNRLRSFGSRVPPLNPVLVETEPSSEEAS